MRFLKLTIVVALFSVIKARPTEKAEDIQSLKEFVDKFRPSNNLSSRLGEADDAQENVGDHVALEVYQIIHNNSVRNGDEDLARVIKQTPGEGKLPTVTTVAPFENADEDLARVIEQIPGESNLPTFTTVAPFKNGDEDLARIIKLIPGENKLPTFTTVASLEDADEDLARVIEQIPGESNLPTFTTVAPFKNGDEDLARVIKQIPGENKTPTFTTGAPFENGDEDLARVIKQIPSESRLPKFTTIAPFESEKNDAIDEFFAPYTSKDTLQALSEDENQKFNDAIEKVVASDKPKEITPTMPNDYPSWEPAIEVNNKLLTKTGLRL